MSIDPALAADAINKNKNTTLSELIQQGLNPNQMVGSDSLITTSIKSANDEAFKILLKSGVGISSMPDNYNDDGDEDDDALDQDIASLESYQESINLSLILGDGHELSRSFDHFLIPLLDGDLKQSQAVKIISWFMSLPFNGIDQDEIDLVKEKIQSKFNQDDYNNIIMLGSIDNIKAWNSNDFGQDLKNLVSQNPNILNKKILPQNRSIVEMALDANSLSVIREMVKFSGLPPSQVIVNGDNLIKIAEDLTKSKASDHSNPFGSLDMKSLGAGSFISLMSGCHNLGVGKTVINQRKMFLQGMNMLEKIYDNKQKKSSNPPKKMAP